MNIGLMLLMLSLCSCSHQSDKGYMNNCDSKFAGSEVSNRALLSTRYPNLKSLEAIMSIEYLNGSEGFLSPAVRVSHCSKGKEVVSILESGVDEGDFRAAQEGGIIEKVTLAINSPYAIQNRSALTAVYYLARRRPDLFKEGDVAFYDIAVQTLRNINSQELPHIPAKDTGEKGFINTFNHITAQAFVTSFHSEDLADFIADSHERHAMPELLTGAFSKEQLIDPDKNPMDNYVDIVNNEWGQEIGIELGLKYSITDQTIWTPELLSDYLNDLQNHYSWAFGIGFDPFKPSDKVIQKFSTKINLVLGNKSV